MQIKKEKVKRKYELTYLIPASFTSNETTEIREEVDKMIKKFSGKVSEIEEWGKNKMSYIIKKAGKSHNEAVYVHLVIEFPVEKINKFEASLKLHQKILRYLIVLASDEVSSFKKQKES